MRRTLSIGHRMLAVSVMMALATVGSRQSSAQSSHGEAPSASAVRAAETFEPVTVKHALGTTVIRQRPQRVAALDMNEVDFLDQLGVPVAGTPKDYVPHFLIKYKDDPDVRNLGSIVKPNLESVYTLKPDLILITSLHAAHYKELSQIAPTIHFDVNYRNSGVGHVEAVREHLMMLGKIFGKEDLARQRAAELDTKIEEARHVTRDRPERALVVLHNNGAFSALGLRSRYGFVFGALGVKPAQAEVDTGLHGQPISSEFVQATNPDIIYVIDRTAVMQHRLAITAESLANPLLRQTNAWKTGRVVIVDSEAWYITAASVGSLKIVVDDVINGYRR